MVILMLKTYNSLEMVARLSKSNNLDINANQSNRYCIKLNSAKGKEAYYFATPIYNTYSRKLVQRKFIASNGCYCFVGSNCEVIVTPTQIQLERGDQNCVLNLGKTYSWSVQDGVLRSDRMSIIPTYNGVCIEGNITQMSFDATVGFGYQDIRASHGCICLMESQFKPVLTMAALFSKGKEGGCSPLQITHSEMHPKNIFLSVVSDDSTHRQGAVEINFYEPKLIQDTPVSQNMPKENNAFGPIAFVGKSKFYGMQWLYSRLDTNKLPELQHKYIHEIKLYVPRLTRSSTAVDVFELSKRFCSFGSTWNKKIAKENRHDTVKFSGDYLCIDLTRHYTNHGALTESGGMVLTPALSSELGYQAISTGDSYVMPPVLCVKYANI